jgi:hypothetical protein
MPAGPAGQPGYPGGGAPGHPQGGPGYQQGTPGLAQGGRPTSVDGYAVQQGEHRAGYPGGGYVGPGPVQQMGRPDLAQPAQYPPPSPQQDAPRKERSSRQAEDETPSWAEPDSVEAFSERWHRRGLDSREERRSGRRKRRRLLIGGGAVIALAIAATIYLVSGGPGAADLGFGNFVTSFLPGELQQVPNPCTAVPQATLNQYMPGKLKQAAPPLNSGADTECTWTLDSVPTYRVLQVQMQAYSPSGLASGNGSATFAAQDAFQTAENHFTVPGSKSGQPKATVTDLSGMPGGSQTSAFQATQVFKRGGATTDVANVFVRYRNVIVTVVVDGLDQSSGGKKYGPVAMSDLTAAANEVAREMAAQIAK